jgi:integrase
MKGHIRERKPGAGYTACWSDTDPGDGHRRQYSRHFAKKGEAQKFLNSTLTRVDSGTFRPDTAITVRQLLCEHWLPAQRSRELRPATLAQYEGVIENWILPRLGAVKVAALTPATVVDFMTALRSEETAKGRQGLSARSVQLATGVLKSACAWAVQSEMIGRNPIQGVRRPRAAAPVMKVWTSDEARAFLEATKRDRLAFAWALLLTRGLRRGEACGLKWPAIDLGAGTLRVEETRITVEGKPVPSRPKTAAGRRSIPLDAQLVEVIRAHRRQQAAEKLAAGNA